MDMVTIDERESLEIFVITLAPHVLVLEIPRID